MTGLWDGWPHLPTRSLYYCTSVQSVHVWKHLLFWRIMNFQERMLLNTEDLLFFWCGKMPSQRFLHGSIILSCVLKNWIEYIYHQVQIYAEDEAELKPANMLHIAMGHHMITYACFHTHSFVHVPKNKQKVRKRAAQVQ